MTNGSEPWENRAQVIAASIRRRVLEHTINHDGGYLSQACSAAEILAVLYTKVLKLGPSQANMIPGPFPGVPAQDNPSSFTGAAFNGPHCPDLDRFYLSCVHYALPLYAALIEAGRMSPDGLEQFNRDGSTVEMIGAEHSPGMELTGGSLAQTISQVGGISLARKRRGDAGRNWVLMSDGEFQEGQTWECVQAMSYYKLDNVAAYVDVNGQQCDGKMNEVMNIEPLAARLEAFGARVATVDAQDVRALAEPAAIVPNGKPLFILAYSNPCAGMPLLESRRPKLHYVRFKDAAERKQFSDFLAEMPAGGP